MRGAAERMPEHAAHGGEAFASHLAEASLSPRGLARELNNLFGPGTVAETAPYHWRDAGGVPRAPLPALTAYVISRHLGHRVTVADLWPGRSGTGDSTLFLPANTGLDGRWGLETTMRIAEDWLLGGLVDRRTFLSVSGSALTQAVSIYMSAHIPVAMATSSSTEDDPLVDQIEASVPRLQQLDDERGGAAGLNYVGAQVRAVLLVLREGGHTDATIRRLLVALADLSQLAGWKAVDAAQGGLAQRYLLTGLRAAHDAGYRPMEAHILADLAYQSASLGDAHDGVALAEAAYRVAERVPASVQASVMSRLAFTYAVAGRVKDCEQTWLKAQDRLANRRAEYDPDWMYYLTSNHLDCQAGYSMILAGRRMTADTGGRSLLRKGEALLRTGAYARPATEPSQRRALHEGAWLALGYATHGKIDDMAAVLRLALPRLGKVRSPRSVALLRMLAKDMRRRKRNQTVADILPELESALTQHRN